MGENRRDHERRHWGREVHYPFRDSEGRTVVRNRRRVVERRLSSVQARSAQPVLRLRFREREFALRNGQLRVGRHSGNDLVINQPVVSRHHGVILALGGGYLLVDTSRNGSYVRLQGAAADIHVQAGEYRLVGKGTIRLGRATDAPGNDLLHFDIS
ncbi:FHA domain-containing protein [Acidihalobacter prosperus]|uniref:FHA domain-containing protein n=1 Tax=Acidihalobacter prosperus TaxID=160660 RepID=UPI0013729A6E|nr:FHA domain-containing protein [Acidihalobacter prosperus]